jgi:hypothetical protein
MVAVYNASQFSTFFLSRLELEVLRVLVLSLKDLKYLYKLRICVDNATT